MANVLALALVLIVIVAGGNAGIIRQAEAQLSPPFSPPPTSSSSSCSASLATLTPCLSFLVGNNPTPSTSPTQSCCSAVTYVASNSAVCLCPLFTANATNNLLGFPVNNIPLPLNQSRAVTLPGACQVSTPLLSQCKVSSGQAGAPAATPGPTGGPVATPVTKPSAAPLIAPSSPSPAATHIAKSPETSVAPSALSPATTSPATSGAVPSALPPATTGGVLSPSKSPATSVALPPTTATTGGVLSPSGSHVRPTASANSGSIMSFSMFSMLMAGLINIIVRIA